MKPLAVTVAEAAASEGRHDEAPPAVLVVEHLSKEYRLYDSPRTRLKALLTGRSLHRSHCALSDVSFTLHRGQCLGVVGDNGAGKSSLLKLLAGTLQPTVGRINRVGRVTAILELGAGFHPDFSGRDNLYFGGSLIGIDAAEMAKLEAGIIAFAELGEAIHRPVKTYSSGMSVRLAFALVTAVQPDVLIIDEALAVGDQHFQKKCGERISQFRENGCTILFCSHSLYHVRQLCDTALWLDRGQVRALGDTESVLASYELHVRRQDQAAVGAAAPQAISSAATVIPVLANGALAGLVSVEIPHLGAGEPPLLESRALVVKVLAQSRADECPSVGVMIEQLHGVGITSVATHADGVQPVQTAEGLWQTTLTFPDLPLSTGDYVVSVYLFDSKGLVVYDERLKCAYFRLVYPSLTPGLVRLAHHWT